MYHNYSPYFGYVKKEDAKEILKRRGITSWIFGGSLLFLFGMVEVFILPKMMELSIELGVLLPSYLYSNTRYVIYLAFLLATFLIKPESDEEINKKLKNYKAGEMILVSKLVNRKYELMLMGVIFAAMAYLIVSIIMPIYDMTVVV